MADSFIILKELFVTAINTLFLLLFLVVVVFHLWIKNSQLNVISPIVQNQILKRKSNSLYKIHGRFLP